MNGGRDDFSSPKVQLRGSHVLPVSLAAWFTRTFCGLLGLLPKVPETLGSLGRQVDGSLFFLGTVRTSENQQILMNLTDLM